MYSPTTCAPIAASLHAVYRKGRAGRGERLHTKTNNQPGRHYPRTANPAINCAIILSWQRGTHSSLLTESEGTVTAGPEAEQLEA